MTLFAIHDETGRISQANKVFVSPEELKKYEALLRDLGHDYAKVRHPGLLPPEYWYVPKKKEGAMRKTITPRPVMQAVAPASTIKAGTDAVILNIPPGSSIDVLAIGAGIAPTTIWSLAVLDGDEFEFATSVPMIYRTVIRLWPFRDCTIDIEALAS
jgi:hypothetical protein